MDYEKQFENICNALAESVFEIPDEEIEVSEKEAEEIREVLFNGVRKYERKRNLDDLSTRSDDET